MTVRISDLMRAGKQRRVRYKRKHEKQHVDGKENDRYRNAQRAKALRRAGAEPCLICRRQNKRDRRQGQHGRLRPGALGVVALFLVAQSACKHRCTQDQEDIADYGAGDRCLDDVVQSSTKCSQGDDEFSRIAEGRVEQPSDAFAHPFRELLCCPAHPGGKWQDSDCRSDEYEEMPLGGQILQSDGDGYKSEQPVQHFSPQGCSDRFTDCRRLSSRRHECRHSRVPRHRRSGKKRLAQFGEQAKSL